MEDREAAACVAHQEVVAQAQAVGIDPTKIIPLLQDLITLWSVPQFKQVLTDFAGLLGFSLSFGPDPKPTP